MNETIRDQAERAALVQRLQLNALHRALQGLESQVADIESESARQSAELSLLAEKLSQLRNDMVRAPDPSGVDSKKEEIGKMVERQQPSPQQTKTVHKCSADLPAIVPPPNLGDDWNAYIRNVDQYISDHGIEVTQDPLGLLLPPDCAAEIRNQFATDFSSAPWDRWDYGGVALAVIVGAVTDYLLVATPGGTFKGKDQRASPLTTWMKEQSKKLAPRGGNDIVDRNAFQQWISGLTTAAEKWAKVPYDVVKPEEGLTPRVHRLASLGHDPLLGLIFGVKDILSGKCTFIDKSGALQFIDNRRYKGSRNPLEALVKVVVHGFSDVFTAQGLPPPFMAPFQLISANSGFTLKKGGDPVPVRDVVRYMYANGYDLRHFVTASISPAIAEVILRTYHSVRAYDVNSEPKEAGIPEKLKREQMRVLTHALLGSANIMKTALYGWNPMAINLAQFQTLAKRMLSLVKLAAERDRAIRDTLYEGWETLLADG